MAKISWHQKESIMKKSDLKQLIKPLVKECIHEVLLEEGLRHVLNGCNRLDAQDLIGTLVRQNFAAQKIIEQASDYIDGLETALLISVRSEDN